MEPEILTLKDYLHILWRRKLFFIIPFFLILGVASAVVVLLPPTYQSTGKILIESQQIPTDLVRSTVSTYAGERISIIKQRVMTRDKLLAIIDKYRLFSDQRGNTPNSEIIERMRGRIIIEMISAATKGRKRNAATIAFDVAYQDHDPVLAQAVANELVTLFLSENVKVRTERATETTDFLRSEADKLKTRIEAMENKIAVYKQQHSDSLPEHLNLHVGQLERARSELRAVKRELSSLAEQRESLEIQLASIRSGSAVLSGEPLEPNSPIARLQMLKLKMLDLSTRYQESHPDVIMLKRQIATLEAELDPLDLRSGVEAEITELRSLLEKAKQAYTEQHPVVKTLEARLADARGRLDSLVAKGQEEGGAHAAAPGVVMTNPAEALLTSKLKAMESKRESLLEDRAALEDRVTVLEHSVMLTPETERGLQELARDYAGAKQKYAEIKSKEMEAALSESLEAGQKAERFILLEPPIRPDKPIKPNRPKLLLLGFVAALAGGAGVVYLLEQMNSGIRSAAMLTQVVGVPPLVVIPYIDNSEDRRRRRRNMVILWAVLLTLVLVGLVVVHFFYRPLDMLWYQLLSHLQ